VEQDILYVPGNCVILHNIFLDAYLFSPREDWLRKYGKAKGRIEKEIEADEARLVV
jgi:hypothetical protein